MTYTWMIDVIEVTEPRTAGLLSLLLARHVGQLLEGNPSSAGVALW